VLVSTATSGLLIAGLLTAVSAQAAVGCRVDYAVTNQWAGGFGAAVTVTNVGDAVNGWTLAWTFPSGQSVTQAWNASVSLGTSQVRATNVSYNASVPTGGTVSFGFNGAWNGSNTAPTSFALNGTTCTGAAVPTSTGPTPGSPPPSSSRPSAPPSSSVPSAPPSSANPGTPPTCNAQPVDPQATTQARKLLCYLYSLYGNHILSGQRETNNSENEINYVYQNSGKYPALRGMDMSDRPRSIDRAISYWNAGGIPIMGWHVGAPTKSDDYTGSQQAVSINATLTPGTAEYQSYISRLDAAATQLQRAQAAGIAILWVPYHEAGGTWFWWSKEGGSQYQRLWRFQFDYFTKTKGIHNLVWLHGYNGSPQASFYPGKAYVDIGGADTYANDHNPQASMFTSARNIYGTTMPIALHENGPIPDPDLLQSTNTRWVLFMTWNSTWLTQRNDPAFIRRVYNHDYVITRDEVPNLR
jgi:hypothetical protein